MTATVFRNDNSCEGHNEPDEIIQVMESVSYKSQGVRIECCCANDVSLVVKPCQQGRQTNDLGKEE